MSKTPEKDSGSHSLGKDNSSTASRRDSHPARKGTRDEHAELIADQRIVHEDNTRFPKHSTADSKKLAARRRKD